MKHNRALLPITIFLAVCFGSQPAEAGVIVDSNGIVTEFTETTNSNTFTFYEGSYYTTQSTSQTTLNLTASERYYYGTNLGAALNSYTGTTTLDTSVSYAVAESFASQQVTLYHTFYSAQSSSWGTISAQTNWQNATSNAGQPFYFASLTAPTGGSTGSVPEPTTAIAMGLLGIVGFAGNRRRRRQVSAA